MQIDITETTDKDEETVSGIYTSNNKLIEAISCVSTGFFFTFISEILLFLSLYRRWKIFDQVY